MISKRKLVAVATAAAATLVLATGCGGGDDSTSTSAGNAKTPPDLLSAGKLQVCMALSYPPMEYYENGTSGKIVGFDADGARALGELWGVQTEFTVMDFAGLVPGLEANRCDVLWGALYMSPERLQVLNGAPYLNTGPGIVVKSADAGSYTKKDDLCGKRIAVQSGGSIVKTLQGYSDECKTGSKPEITISQYPMPSEAIAAVRNGKVDALIETDVSVADIVKHNTDLAATASFLDAETEFGVFTTKQKQPLTDAVASGIKELIANGTMAKIATTYGLSADKVPAAS